MLPPNIHHYKFPLEVKDIPYDFLKMFMVQEPNVHFSGGFGCNVLTLMHVYT